MSDLVHRRIRNREFGVHGDIRSVDRESRTPDTQKSGKPYGLADHEEVTGGRSPRQKEGTKRRKS
jgi:hypothetical protein